MEILSLEASTTSAKAMRYHTEDGTFEVRTREYDVDCTSDPRLKDAEHMYQQMMAVGREVAEGHHIDMISLSGTWHSVLLCDQNMVPQTPVYMWNYTGAADLCRELRKDAAYVSQYYHKTGSMVHSSYPVFKLELLRRQGWKLENYLPVSQGTYNTYRMTGKRVSTKCLTSGSGLMNLDTRTYDPDVLREFHLREEQLSQLVEYDQTFPLNDEAAKLLGIASGIPVIPTNSDGGLNQVGVGALEEGVATFSVGTSGAIRLTTDRPDLPETPSTWCYLSPKAWLKGAATSGCCNCLDWAKAKLFPAGMGYDAIEAGVTDLETTPVFLPFLFGERCPGWNDERRGGFFHILPTHNANDLYRAVQEGTLFNLYHCYQMLSKGKQPIKELKISGGILNSPTWKQMCADIFNRTLTIDNAVHGSMLGSVVLAMELLGVIGDAREYHPQVTGVIEPNPEKVEFYQKKFQRYLACYACGMD